MLRTKRVYEKRRPGDGKRILVDRLWPRGLKRDEAEVDEWMKDIAPSDELRRWFGHRTEKWAEFKERYIRELNAPEKGELLEKVVRMAREGNVTLVYSARDEGHNNARVLQEIMESIAVSGISGRRSLWRYQASTED